MGLSSYMSKMLTGAGSWTDYIQTAAVQLVNGSWADAVTLVDANGNPVPVAPPVVQVTGRQVLTATAEVVLLAGVAGSKLKANELTVANLSMASQTLDIRDAVAGPIRKTVTVLGGTSIHVALPQGLIALAAGTSFTVQARGNLSGLEVSASAHAV